ncbi:MAG: hypothetical protein KR126chlam3_01577 [Chlamydiae bacterium]|nr:hypothetical protein [Chlamydiota bacterium]
MSVLAEVENCDPQSRRCITENTQSVYLESGPTFFSRIPFHFVRARICQDDNILSEVNIKAGSTFQWDPNLLTDETKEFQILACSLSNGKECIVGVLRGNVQDLTQEETFYLINRSL